MDSHFHTHKSIHTCEHEHRAIHFSFKRYTASSSRRPPTSASTGWPRELENLLQPAGEVEEGAFRLSHFPRLHLKGDRGEGDEGKGSATVPACTWTIWTTKDMRRPRPQSVPIKRSISNRISQHHQRREWENGNPSHLHLFAQKRHLPLQLHHLSPIPPHASDLSGQGRRRRRWAT